MMAKHHLLSTLAVKSELYKSVSSTAQMLSLIHKQEESIQEMAYRPVWTHVGGGNRMPKITDGDFP